MKAIETLYNGYRFRSRLEARWAVFFDAINIQYEYEPEGYLLSDGTKYLPDFYLPESDTFFEVKGIMNDIDLHKITQFITESKKPLVIGYSDFTFEACDDYCHDEEDLFLLARKDMSTLIECPKCGKHYFLGENGGWCCRCCGEYDGDSYHNIVCWGDIRYEPEQHIANAIIKAKQARFEHGEYPVIGWK